MRFSVWINQNVGSLHIHRVSALILLAASTLFPVYSASLIFSPKVSHYHFYIAIGIAAFTFTEIGLNLRGLLIERKNKSMLLYAVKMESLASSLICLVLTQKALLSFSYSGEQVALSKFHGAFGAFHGGYCNIDEPLYAAQGQNMEDLGGRT